MKKAVLLILFILIAWNIEAQKIKFYVESGELNYLDCPVSFRLNPDTYSGKENVMLYDVSAQNKENVSLQEDPNEKGRFWFVVEGEFTANTRKDFLLVFEEEEKVNSKFAVDIANKPLND